MKWVMRTQLLAISFSIFWIIYLNILVFFDQPEHGLKYINWFVNGFAAFFGVIVMILTRFISVRRFVILPLVLVPEFVIYQPILERLFQSFLSKGYKMIFHFLSLSTGMVYLIAILLGLLLGTLFQRPQKN